MALYVLAIRDWDIDSESFVSAVVKSMQPDSTDYIEGVLDAVLQNMHPPMKTGELASSLRMEVQSPTRGKILMAYYGVWVDRGHRVVKRSESRYRIRFDLNPYASGASANYLARTRPANFIRAAYESPAVKAAIGNVQLAFRRRQAN